MHRLLTPLLLFAVLASFTLGSAGSPTTAARDTRRYAVVVVLDGARPDYFRLVKMPNLAALVRRGTNYSNAFVGQEIANTPPSHATIGTGLFPKHHGVQGFAWKDPVSGQMIRPTDLVTVQHGDLEAILSENHVPSIAAEVKSRDRSARIVTISGHKCYAADAMGTAAADYILCANIYHDRWVAQAIPRHIPPPGAINNPRWDHPIPNPKSGIGPAVQQWQIGAENEWTVDYALWAFRRVHYPRVLMINLPETDVTGHFTRKVGWVQRALMTHFDRELGLLVSAYRRAGILSRTDFVITADHAMAHVKDRIPFGDLDRAMELAGATKIYLEADTGASIGISQLGLAHAVASNIARLDRPLVDATLYKVKGRGGWRYKFAYANPALTVWMRRAYQMLANTAASPAGPEVIANYKPGVTTGDRIANGYHWWGGHLGPSWEEQHIPLFIAGPGIRRGFVSSYPARLVDIAPTIEHLLGVPSGRVDGHILADMLTAPDHAAARTQRSLNAQLTPLVRALKERQKNEGSP